VNTAIQEDANAIAYSISRRTYEYFKYMYDLLQEKRQIKFLAVVVAILPSEIAELQAYGITNLHR
jgi:methylmalonyl-CoA mutase cobalamin-binding subunit